MSTISSIISSPSEIEKKKFHKISAVLSVCYLCLSCGNFFGYTSSAIPSMKFDTEIFPHLNEFHYSWIGGLGPMGGLFGSLLSYVSLAYFSGNPKQSIIRFGWTSFIISWSCLGVANSIYMVFIGRFLGGIGTGVVICNCPLYVIQISSNSSESRGRFGVVPQFLMVLGILISYILGTFLSWRFLALACLAISLPAIILLIYAPNTGTNLAISSSSEGVKEPHLEQNDENKKSYRYLKPTLLALALISFQQLTGINGITFFALNIFEETIFQNAHHPAIILASAQVLASLISTQFIDKSGRKFLLIISSLSVTMSMGLLGFYFYFLKTQKELYWVPLALLIIFSFGFALGYGGCVWIFIAEIFPEKIRSIVQPLCMCVSWLIVLIVTMSFPYLHKNLKIYSIFWIYSGFGVVGLAFIIIFLPETKGKGIDEISAVFDRQKRSRSNNLNNL